MAPSTVDVPFLFHNFPWLPPTPGELAVSDIWSGYLARFARTADPTSQGAFIWPRWDETDPYLVVDSQLSTGAGWRTTECDFWDQF
jgi:hypothetical protein